MKTIILSLIFVMLFGSGFVATQYGLPYADPISFLVIRFAITATLLGLACLIFKPAMPGSMRKIMHTMIAGVLMVGVFTLGVFLAIDYGISASTSALIISFQPLLASLIARGVYKATISVSQWLGLLIGLTGVIAIVFWGLESPSLIGLAMAVLGLLGATFGSVYQKYYCEDMHLVFGGFVQSAASCVFCAMIWLFYPTHFVEWTFDFIFSLLWMAIAISIGAISVLYLLIRNLPISKVSTLFYLVPISALCLQYIFLDGTINLFQSVGIILVSISVFIVSMLGQRGSAGTHAAVR